MKQIDYILYRLSLSKFRNSFHLKTKDLEYIKEKGLDKIKEHCYDFISKRIALQNPYKDGKQTPTKGHPVFIAEHATATCCRSCIEKWHHIPKNTELTKEQIDYIVTVIMTWINNEIKKNV